MSTNIMKSIKYHDNMSTIYQLIWVHMSTNGDKHLVLRGKNKDIYFIQKRVSKKVSSIIGTDFIKKSLETSDINIARIRRDKILDELLAHELTKIDENTKVLDQSSPEYKTNASDNENLSVNSKIDEKERKIDIDKVFSIKDLKITTKDKLIEKIDAFVPITIAIISLIVAYIVG